MAILRSPLILLTVVALLLILPGIANRDFSTRGEPREALIAQSMVASGEWVIGRGYGDVVPSKPPLTHWIAALSARISGEMAPLNARIPSAFSAVIGVMLFFLFLSDRFGAARGLLTSLILLTSIEWFRTSITARVDMTLSVTLLAGLLSMYRWVERETKGVPWGVITFLTLATLTKGPVSIAIPGLVIATFLRLRGRSIGEIVRAGVMLFAPTMLLASLWYVAAYLDRRDAFVDRVWYENVQRFLGTQEDEPHKGSVVGLWLSVVVGLLPWSLFLIPALHRVRGRTLPLSTFPRRLWTEIRDWFRRAHTFEQFAAIVILVVLLFFAIPGSKRSVYLLPAYPFAAFFLSGIILHFEGVANATSRKAALVVTQGLGVFSLLVLGVVAAIVVWPEWGAAIVSGSKVEHVVAYYGEALRTFVRQAGVGAWSAMLASLLLSVGLALRARFPPVIGSEAWRAVAVWWVALLFMGNTLLFPALVSGLSSRPFAQTLATVLPSGERLYSYGTEFYGVSFYLGRAIFRFEDFKPLTGLVLLNEADFPAFREIHPYAQVVLRSGTPITKPDDFVLLVRVT